MFKLIQPVAIQVKVALMGHKSNTQAQEVAMDTRDMVNHIQDVVCATADGVARLHDDDDVSHLLIDLDTMESC
jgi:hypothetical protein